jgi:hypothetical protein
VAVNEALTMCRLQPQDDVAVALAGLAHGLRTVEDGLLDVNEALAVLTNDGPQRHVLGQRRADGVVGGRAVLAMRIIGSKIFEDRPTISTSLCHSRLWSMPSEAGDNRS